MTWLNLKLGHSWLGGPLRVSVSSCSYFYAQLLHGCINDYRIKHFWNICKCNIYKHFMPTNGSNLKGNFGMFMAGHYYIIFIYQM